MYGGYRDLHSTYGIRCYILHMVGERPGMERQQYYQLYHHDSRYRQCFHICHR